MDFLVLEMILLCVCVISVCVDETDPRMEDNKKWSELPAPVSLNIQAESYQPASWTSEEAELMDKKKDAHYAERRAKGGGWKPLAELAEAVPSVKKRKKMLFKPVSIPKKKKGDDKEEPKNVKKDGSLTQQFAFTVQASTTLPPTTTTTSDKVIERTDGRYFMESTQRYGNYTEWRDSIVNHGGFADFLDLVLRWTLIHNEWTQYSPALQKESSQFHIRAATFLRRYYHVPREFQAKDIPAFGTQFKYLPFKEAMSDDTRFVFCHKLQLLTLRNPQKPAPIFSDASQISILTMKRLDASYRNPPKTPVQTIVRTMMRQFKRSSSVDTLRSDYIDMVRRYRIMHPEEPFFYPHNLALLPLYQQGEAQYTRFWHVFETHWNWLNYLSKRDRARIAQTCRQLRRRISPRPSLFTKSK